MTKRLLWQAPDGSLKITIPVESPLPGESETRYLDRIALAAQATDPGLAGCVRLAAVDPARLPGSRHFRNCWRSVAGTVQVDLPAARQQRLAEIRAERDRRLLESDALQARLEEIGSPGQQQELAVYRQQLRDLPVSVAADLAALNTAAELEAYQPAWPTPPQE